MSFNDNSPSAKQISDSIQCSSEELG